MPLGFGGTQQRRSGVQQQTITVNQFGLSERQRTTSRGTSSRFTVTIKAQPVHVLFDAKAMGQPVAEAMVRVIQDGIRGLNETVTPATQNFRQRALGSFQAGTPWAKKRYGGAYIAPSAGVTQGKRSNRLPPMPPNPHSPSFWRDSGRFIAGLVARPTRDNEWVINVPANRFDPVTFHGGREALLTQIARLQELVPEFGDARALERHEEVRMAIGEATDQILFGLVPDKLRRQAGLRRALRRGQLDVARGILRGLGADWVADLVTVL